MHESDTLLWRRRGRRIPINEFNNRELNLLRNWLIIMSQRLNPNFELYDIKIKKWIDAIDYELNKRELYRNENNFREDNNEIYTETGEEMENDLEILQGYFYDNDIII